MEKKIWIIPTFPLEINGIKYKLIISKKYFKIQAKFRKLLSNKQITKDPSKKALAQNLINDSSFICCCYDKNYFRLIIEWQPKSSKVKRLSKLLTIRTISQKELIKEIT